MSIDKEDQQPKVNDSLNTLSVRNHSLYKEKHRPDLFGEEKSIDTVLNEMSINEDDMQFYEILGLKTLTKEMFSDNSFNFAALHKVINMLVRNLGRTVQWLSKREHVIEQICTEFDDDEDESDKIDQIFSGQETFRHYQQQDKTRLSQPKISNLELKEPSDKSESIATKSRDIESELPTNRSGLTNTISNQVTPRVRTSQNLKQDKKRLIDPISTVATKKVIPKMKDLGKTQMMHNSMTAIKDSVKSELYMDLKNMVDSAVSENASLINVMQIQRVPENKTETIKEEIDELKTHLSKFVVRYDTLEKKMIEFERNQPRINQDLSNLRNDLSTRCSKEELTQVNIQIPNFATNQDIDIINENLESKTNLETTNELKIMIEKVAMDQNKYVLIANFNERQEEIDDTLKRLFETKCDKLYIQDKLDEIALATKERDDDLTNYKSTVTQRFEIQNRTMKKLEVSIENKAEKDQIWELRDIIRDLVDRKTIQDLEDKIFPIMKDIIGKIENFDERIDECKRSMIRYDEIMLDKASKYDFIATNKKIESMLSKKVFEELQNSFEIFRDKISDKVSENEQRHSINTSLIEHNKHELSNIHVSITKMQANMKEVITNEDLNDLREKIDTKADKLQIAQIYDIKSNKVDITSLVKSIDFVHKQLEYQSMIGVSTLKSLISGMQDADNNNSSNKSLLLNRSILLKHASNVSNWISFWKVGDVYQDKKDTKVPKELNNFPKFAEDTMAEVQEVCEQINYSTKNILTGNKGFSKVRSMSRARKESLHSTGDFKEHLPTLNNSTLSTKYMTQYPNSVKNTTGRISRNATSRLKDNEHVFK